MDQELIHSRCPEDRLAIADIFADVPAAELTQVESRYELWSPIWLDTGMSHRRIDLLRATNAYEALLAANRRYAKRRK